MAKLVGLNRNNEYNYQEREIPLVVDVDLTMVLQFSDQTNKCYNISTDDLEKFKKKFSTLSKVERRQAITAESKDVDLVLKQKISCVGCRRSIETMIRDLKVSGRPSLDPFVIGSKTLISIRKEHMQSAEAVYALLYICSTGLLNNLQNLQISKKNKRCSLHSMDMHKSKVFGFVDVHQNNKSAALTQVIQTGWKDVWDVLSDECKNEILIIDPNDLLFTMDKYLKKHRFCLDCKGKVLRAFSILNGDVKPTGGCQQEPIDKGYNPDLYEHIKVCGAEKHLHMINNTELLTSLIEQATPDLIGSSRRERHAKTMDIAQDEVLTCLGIHLGERILKIRQKLKDEEQTWQLVYAICTEVLRKNFELAIEKKQGISNLELLCYELDIEENKKLTREHMRKQKKRNKRKATKLLAKEQSELLDTCACGNKVNEGVSVVGKTSKNKPKFVEVVVCSACKEQAIKDSLPSAGNRSKKKTPKDQPNAKQDGGYASGPDSQSSASSAISSDSFMTSSDRLEEICSDNDCNCHKLCKEGSLFGLTSLQDMLEESDKDAKFTEAELRQFKKENNSKELATMRQKIRLKMKENFEDSMLHTSNGIPKSANK